MPPASLRIASVVAAASFFMACGALPSTVRPASGGDSAALRALYAREWEWGLQQYPEMATLVGDSRYNGRLEDLSFAAIERRKVHARALQRELRGFHAEALVPEERLNLELFQRETNEAVAGLRFPSDYLALDQFRGPQQALPELAENQPRLRVKDFEDWLARLRATPLYIEQVTALLRKGIEQHVVTPRVVLKYVGPALAKQLVDDPRRSPLYTIVFGELPAWMPATEGERLRSEAAKIIQEQVTPAFARFNRFFEKDYLPHARDTVGWSTLPDGTAWYAYLVQLHTTTTRSPAEIHQIGLDEVNRIRGEMERTKAEAGFVGSMDAYFRHLRTDPKNFFSEPTALVSGYRDVTKRIDPELPKLFGRLPRLPYGVTAVPAYSEGGMPAAYYVRGSLVAGRAGMFYANTSQLKTRPRWEMESLALHEAVPGHHLQLALAQEQEDVPEFRRYSEYTAFVEGWGLYAESLGNELGLYRDPSMRFGRLVNEIWRATRLVIDTGLHAKGWSREQALRYFAENIGGGDEDVAVEVDRYIAWAGQALAYKMGELKLQELRRKAEQQLAPKFSLRDFHDRVLRTGGVPLDVLERQVDAWIADQRPSQER